MKMIDKMVDMVIDGLGNGTVAWCKTWKDFSPVNAFSKRNCTGLNIFYRSFLCAENRYARPLFGTYRQISDAGGHVRKGEKSSPIVYRKVSEGEAVNGETDETESVKRFTPFYYNVFNLSQTEGIDPDDFIGEFSTAGNNPPEACEHITCSMPDPPCITHDKPGAFYVPSRDMVNVPDIRYFDGSEEYHNTLFHELSHATGHPRRLNRFKDNDAVFGRYSYNYEELVAEMAATLLCSHCGIDRMVDNSVAYLTGWAKFLKEERKTTLFGAATKAQAAVNFILGKAVTGEPAQQEEISAPAV